MVNILLNNYSTILINNPMREVDKKSKLFTEAHKGETSEEILAEMRGEEPISEELECASEKYACRFSSSKYGHDKVKNTFIAGAKWQEQQFEKERLKHCDALTKEQAQIESDFVTQHIKENNRTPTFIDAIEYGMKKQKEQMMAKAIDVEVHVDAGGYSYIPQIELYDYDKDVPLAKEGDNVKVIVIKEEKL